MARQGSNNKNLYRFLFATATGTFLEFFDLALYSFCSVLIAKFFFPEHTDSSLAITLTWVIFAVSYLMRPLGALWLGHLADSYSSKRAMLISMLMMAFATCGLGLLPTYARIGMAAPLLLLLLRIMQSIAVSPEYNLPSVFIKNNNWCGAHYGLVSSISASVTGLGMLSASWVMGKILGDANILQIPQYYWRAPFIVAGILVGTLGIYLRWNIDDSLIIKRPKASPMRLILKYQFADFLQAIFIAGYIGVMTYALFSFLVHQLNVVRGMSPGAALSMLGLGVLILPSFSLIAGYSSDYIPRYLLMLIAAAIMLIGGYMLFNNLAVVSEYAILIQTLIMLAGLGFFAGGFPGYLAELFAVEYRYTGSFLAYNIGMSWIGGISPLLFISLAKLNNALPIWLISVYSLLVIVLLIRPLLSFAVKQTDVI